MTNEEAIKILRDTPIDIRSTREDDILTLYATAHNMAIDALEASAWIPVGDEPPKQKKTYWICTDGGYQCECRWTNVNPFWTDLTTDWHWCIGDVPQHSEVVAWMPLPKPYKGGDDNGKD